jgi:SET domain
VPNQARQAQRANPRARGENVENDACATGAPVRGHTSTSCGLPLRRLHRTQPTMATIPGLRVVRSKIEGYGVIATRPFAPGDLIAEVEGVLWHEADDVDDRYSLIMDDGYLLDMVDQTRWINHSCDPNAEVDAGFDPDRKPWARITAIRPIQPGDEITYDYAFDPEVAEPCACGSERCRGYIIDPDAIDAISHLPRPRARAVSG